VTTYPSATHGEVEVSFMETLPEGVSPWAVVAFGFAEGRVLVANIPGRGWCVPSGRIEPEETVEEAATRECFEETGAVVSDVRPIGGFRWGSDRFSAAVVVRIEELRAIPARSESVGREMMPLTELPSRYYWWNPLVEAVFARAIRMSV
jgi:8-oxo-dGTP diphosphatase